MNAALLKNLEGQGVKLSLASHEEHLTVEAPKGVEPETVALIRRHKSELLTYLRGSMGARVSERTTQETG